MILLLICVVPAHAQPGGQADFSKSLATATALGNAGKWADAKKVLHAALTAHASTDYVRARRDEVIGLARQCDFHASMKTPTYQDGVNGKLLSFDEKRGRIKIRYDRDTMADWERAGSDGQVRLHPLIFTGPHKITVKGKAYPDGNAPGILVCSGSKSGYWVVLGRGVTADDAGRTYVPAKLINAVNDEVLDSEDNPPCKAGKPYTLEISISATVVRGSYNGKEVVNGAKPKDVWGNLAIQNLVGFDEIVLEGECEPQWVQERLDRLIANEQRDFNVTWKANKALPTWLFEKIKPKEGLAKLDGSPVRVAGKEALSAANRVAETLRAADLPAFKRAIAKEGAALPGEVRDYLSLQLYDRLGMMEEALGLAQSLKAHFGGSGYFQAYEARFLSGLGRRDEAATLFDALLAQFPAEPILYEDYAASQMFAGRFDQAIDIVVRGRLHGIEGGELDRLYATLLKARDGPPWMRKMEARSARYRVFTDLNESVAKAVLQQLESAYLSYQTDLEWVKRDPSAPPFIVYVFSGSTGYGAYCQDLYGSAMPNSAGLFVSSLKQLLILNVPETEQMMRTVRHEGLHQYLDEVLPNTPIWFNEGMAEYYESADYKGGRWQTGAIRKDHLETIKRSREWKLESFLRTPQREFMEQAVQAYAQSWAFIHFLRHSDREKKLLFAKFFEAARATGSSLHAVEEVLASLDLPLLELQFREFLKNAK